MYRFSNLITSIDDASTAVERESQPCFILMNAERQLLQASPAAHRRRERCAAIRLVHGAVCANAGSEGAALFAAFRAVLIQEAPECTVTLGDDEDRIEIHLVPLHGIDGSRQVIARVRSVVGNCEEQLGHAIRRFGLTPAEGRLLKVLCTGASVQQAALRLGVARTTARTHLQRIFDKSGAHRQGELQRLVFAPALAA